jgi:hypothetical protein
VGGLLFEQGLCGLKPKSDRPDLRRRLGSARIVALARSARCSNGDEASCAQVFLDDVSTAKLQLPVRDDGDLRSGGRAFQAEPPRRFFPILNFLHLQHRRRARLD